MPAILKQVQILSVRRYLVLVINTINAVEMYTEDQINCVTDEENGMILFVSMRNHRMMHSC